MLQDGCPVGVLDQHHHLSVLALAQNSTEDYPNLGRGSATSELHGQGKRVIVLPSENHNFEQAQ